MASVPRILIVDEDLDSRVETRKSVQRAQLDISGEVGLGTEAVSFCVEGKPDVILLAVEEPVTRPLETAEALQNVLPETPVIFYSSLTDPESMRRAVQAGARDYLYKPLQSAALRQSVTRALEHEEKRQMRRAGQLAGAGVRGTVIAVTGAKGGIGKSVLATNLALSIKRQTGAKIVVVDADTQFGDVATLLDIKPEITVGAALANLERLDRWNVNDYLTPGPEGLMVLAENPDKAEWEETVDGACRKIIDLLALSNDFVLVDTSGSMDRFVRHILETATIVLMVTTGEVSSVRDTKSALKRLDEWHIPREKVKLVFNRGARADGFKTKDVEATFERSLFWELPRDNAVPRSVQIGYPVVIDRPKAKVSRSISTLATTIGGSARQVAEKKRRPLLGGLRGRKTEA